MVGFGGKTWPIYPECSVPLSVMPKSVMKGFWGPRRQRPRGVLAPRRDGMPLPARSLSPSLLRAHPVKSNSHTAWIIVEHHAF